MKMKEMIWLDEGRDSKESGAEIIFRIFVEVLRAYGANSEGRQPS
jgi:hypothetical protein